MPCQSQLFPTVSEKKKRIKCVENLRQVAKNSRLQLKNLQYTNSNDCFMVYSSVNSGKKEGTPRSHRNRLTPRESNAYPDGSSRPSASGAFRRCRRHRVTRMVSPHAVQTPPGVFQLYGGSERPEHERVRGVAGRDPKRHGGISSGP